MPGDCAKDQPAGKGDLQGDRGYARSSSKTGSAVNAHHPGAVQDVLSEAPGDLFFGPPRVHQIQLGGDCASLAVGADSGISKVRHEFI